MCVTVTSILNNTDAWLIWPCVSELGKKKLLRKAQARGFCTTIVSLFSSGDRIFVGDSQESVHFCKYNRINNSISIFADDVIPRHLMPNAVLPLGKLKRYIVYPRL